MDIEGTRAQPVTPRPAATVLLVRDDPFEVLMIRRHAAQTFSSALVFPGGLVDPADHADEWLDVIADHDGFDLHQRALRIAAFRETFEETGVLLARDGGGEAAPVPLGEGRSFLETVRASGGRLYLSDLVHFAHWITPPMMPHRFDTHFFLCRAGAEHVATCDGKEAVALEWAPPRAVLDRAAAGEAGIIFPTRLNLSLLAQSSATAEALDAARGRKVHTVEPRTERRPGGIATFIPTEAGYGVTEFFMPERDLLK